MRVLYEFLVFIKFCLCVVLALFLMCWPALIFIDKFCERHPSAFFISFTLYFFMWFLISRSEDDYKLEMHVKKPINWLFSPLNKLIGAAKRYSA